MNARILFFLLLSLIAIQNASGQWIEASGDTYFKNFNVFSLAANQTYLFAGTGAGTTASFFRSSDNGLNWAESGLKNTNVLCLAVNGSNIFAGVSSTGDSLSVSGVFLSDNNGDSWIPVPNTPGSLGAISVLSASDSDIYAGGKKGLFRSINNGASWNSVGFKDTAIYSFARQDQYIYAGTYFGLFRSSDRGSSWLAVDSGLEPHIRSLAVNGTNVFAGTFQGVYRSTNNGANWIQVNDGFPVRSVGLVFARDSDLFAANYFGIFRSTDSGQIWSQWSDQSAFTLLVKDSNMFMGNIGLSGVWRRSLSDLALSVGSSSGPDHSVSTYPNPFSRSTSIKFTSDKSGFTQVSIRNLLGSEVARLFRGSLDGGEHSFTWDARDMPPGILYLHHSGKYKHSGVADDVGKIITLVGAR